MLIDTHAHLTDERYAGAEAIIAAMADDGLERIVTVGYDLPSSRAAAALAAAHPAVYFAAGVHPNDTGRLRDGDLDELLALTRDPKCVAIGEIGLDYHYPDTDKATQLRWLEAQLELAAQTKLPVVFHIRDAYGDFDAVMRRKIGCLTGGAVLHCFSGSKEFALHYVDNGFYVSFSGSITFKNAVRLAEVVPAIPADRLLVETDCPYLTPHPYRGRRNDSSYMLLTAEKAAELRGISVERLCSVTLENAARLFPRTGILPPSMNEVTAS